MTPYTEKTYENRWFIIQYTRQVDDKLYGHIQYKEYNKQAKKETLHYMKMQREPIYAFIHNEKHWKYLKALGFVLTGETVFCDHPSVEQKYFEQVVWNYE